jgi:hypothetical protein
MNPKSTATRRLLPWLASCLVAIGSILAPAPAHAQPSPNAPDRLTYQGFLVDANGAALATNAPRNYDIIFRIYDDPNAGTLMWGEQQTVTVDRGNFSVILGEGIENGGDPRPLLSTVFRGATASDRYIAVTVKGIGAGGGNADIMPRLRFLTSPYSFLAQQANKIVKADGTDLLSANNNLLTLDGSLRVGQANWLELGSGLVKEENAGRIVYGGFTPNTLDIVGGGTNNTSRQVKIWAEGGTTFTGPVTATQFNGSGAGLTGVVRTQPGGHISFGENGVAGTSGYGSAAIFTGAPGSGNSDPLWISRFNAAPDSSELRISIGDNPADSSDKLVIGTMEGNGGNFTQSGTWTPMLAATAQGFLGVGTASPRDALEVARRGDATAEAVIRLVARVSFAGLRNPITGGWYFAPFTRDEDLLIVRNDSGLLLGVNYTYNNNGAGFNYVTYDGDGNWDFPSDRRLKKDIVDAEPMLGNALKVQVRRYRWRQADSTAPLQLGVIAQELQPLFPHMVTEVEHPDTHEKTLSVGYGDFGVIAIKAIQEMKATHDEELGALRAELAEVKAQLKEVLAAAKQLQGNQASGSGKPVPAGR